MVWGLTHKAFIHDVDLVERAVRWARPRTTRGYAYRWVAVKDTLGVGAQTAIALCRRFKLDPDEQIRADGRVRPAKKLY